MLVLLAAHNGAKWIEAQVESILTQQGVDVSLVIGDDVSTDDTRRLVAARWGSDDRVQVIAFEAPSGSAGASFRRLMCAADASACDVVALSDQDDRWFPDKLRAAVEILGRQGAAGYSAAVQVHWADGRTSVSRQCPQTRRADFLFEGAGQGCTFVLRRDFFERAQRFLHSDAGAAATMHFHDWMLYALSRAWGLGWTFDPVARMAYRQHGGNDIGARGGLAGLLRRLRMIRSGWYAEQVARACRTYVAAGGCDPAALALVQQLARGEERGLAASICLAFRLLRDGRRRASDRAVLFVAAVARWI